MRINQNFVALALLNQSSYSFRLEYPLIYSTFEIIYGPNGNAVSLAVSDKLSVRVEHGYPNSVIMLDSMRGNAPFTRFSFIVRGLCVLNDFLLF